MSYSRWSTDIYNVVPEQERLEMYCNGKTSRDILDLKEARGAYNSDWYIFWSVNSSTISRNSQVLSVWSKRVSEKPDYLYSELVDIIATDSFSAIPGYSVASEDDREWLKICVSRFIADVEDEFGQ